MLFSGICSVSWQIKSKQLAAGSWQLAENGNRLFVVKRDFE
jgi:hypothetical protein